MGLKNVVYGFTKNFPYLLTSKHSFFTKLRILLIHTKLNLKYLTYARLFRKKTEKFFGFKVSSFNYTNIRFLFEEIFFRNEYYYSGKKNPVILDCGANIGVATLYFKWLFPKAEIHAFEPDPDTFKLLKLNIEQNNLKKVSLYNAAVTDFNGNIDFFYDSDDPGNLAMSTKFERMPKKKVKVKAISLSSFLKNKKIDFFKLDIEGAESEVLPDLDKTNKLKNIQELAIEYHHKITKKPSALGNFLSILEKNGFEYQVDGRSIPLSLKNNPQDLLIRAYKQK